MRNRSDRSSRAWVLGLSLTLTAGPATSAAPLVLPINHRVDVELHGDDPSTVIPIDLVVTDPAAPLLLRIDGYFENLVTTETGVRYDLYWPAPGGGAYAGFLGPDDFLRLPPPAELATLPVHFEQTVPLTPPTVFLQLEGGGPDDHVRFLGEFELVQVPEPAGGLLTLAPLFALHRRTRGR